MWGSRLVFPPLLSSSGVAIGWALGFLGFLGLRFALGNINTLTGLGLADLLLLHLVCEGILVGVGHHVQFFQHIPHQPVLVHLVVRQVR